jgi:hypothetical protein
MMNVPISHPQPHRFALFRSGFLILVVPLLCLPALGQSANGALTAQLGAGGTLPLPLVNHGDLWRYRKGTSAPPVGWQTNAESTLDNSWLSGPGGFGYGDAAIAGEATALNDMPNGYTTLYIRKSFDVSSEVDTNRHLKLTIDFDDGYVAYLDGAELSRTNAPGAPGTVVAYATNATANHEASCCTPPTNPPNMLDLGPVGDRLGIGGHVLALQGLNATNNSSDFHLIADLAVAAPPSYGGGVFFAIVNTNRVLLSGSNTVPNSIRVVVNGEDAAFDAAPGTWSKTQTLSPGFNRLTVQALDSAGNTLATTNQDIVVELASSYVGGALPNTTAWDSSTGIIHVTNNLVVPVGGTLSIGQGTVLLFQTGASILATNASITVSGVATNPVYFLPADGTTVWGGLVAVGTNGNLRMQHAESIAGHVEVLEGATGLVEDCYLHDYLVSSPPIVHALRAASLTLRRNHVQHYYEHLIQLTPVVMEDCLVENITGDGIDFDGAPPGSAIRRCTIRHGDVFNVDGLDMGNFTDGTPSRGVVIEDCLIYDFTFDKGVSIGEAAQNITVRNCVIYGVQSGVAVKDSSVAIIHNNTIVDSEYGLHLYEKIAGQGGGHATAYNNIIWGVGTNAVLDSLSTVTNSYSDLSGAGIYPGTSNINADPLFIDAAARDYRLRTNSPCIGAGLDGYTLGAVGPVGGVPAAPGNLVAALWKGTNVYLSWSDNSDNETSFEIQRSNNATNWTSRSVAGANETNFVDAAVQPGATYYYRVRANNLPGNSDFSNPALLTLPLPPTIVRQPVSKTVSPGDDVTFNVSATGSEPIHYQWRAGYLPGDIPGATNDTLVLTNVHTGMSGNIRVIVSNPASSVMSAIAVLSVVAPPSITNAGLNTTNVSFAFTSLTNLGYVVEYKDTLSDPAWLTLRNVNGVGGVLTISDGMTNLPSRFYRIRVP